MSVTPSTRSSGGYEKNGHEKIATGQATGTTMTTLNNGTMTLTSSKHTISMRVHDRPGALSRVAQVFARRGFNIDSLVVSRGHSPGFSRMTIVCEGDPKAVEQIVKQLYKLVDTTHASEHRSEGAVERELALVKVTTTPETRTEIFQVTEVFKGRTVDTVSYTHLTLPTMCVV